MPARDAALRTLRIAHVLAPAPFGGLEQVVRALASEQVKRGHDVHVVHVLEQSDMNPAPDLLPDTGVNVHLVRVRPRRYLAERAAVRAVAAAAHADVLHTHGYRPDVIDSGVAPSVGAARVTTVHGFTGGSLKNRIFEALQVRAFRRFEAVVAVSRPLRALLAARGVGDERLHCIPNAWAPAGAAPLSRQEARSTLGIPDSDTLVGWVGRLSAEKAPDVLLAALAHLRDVPCRVAFIGDGRERDDLHALADRLGVSDRVSWCGAVQSAGRYFPAFDVFALTSRTEGTPIVLFEAMAVGVPIVATRVGGVPDVLSTQEAWLVASEAPVEVAAALREVLGSATERRARTSAARVRLDTDYAPDRWLAQYDETYARALQARSR